MWRVLQWLWQLGSVVLTVLGIGGAPDDCAQWRIWLREFDFSDPNWFLVGAGIALLAAPLYVRLSAAAEKSRSKPGDYTTREAIDWIAYKSAWSAATQHGLAALHAVAPLEQALRDGRVESEGRRVGSPVYERIDRRYWETAGFAWPECMNPSGDAGFTEAKRVGVPIEAYVAMRFPKQQIQETCPRWDPKWWLPGIWLRMYWLAVDGWHYLNAWWEKCDAWLLSRR